MTSLKTATTDPATTKAEALVVGLIQQGSSPVLVAGAEAVDAAFGGALADTLASLGATGAHGEITKTATLGLVTAPMIVAVGLGKDPDEEAVRRAFGVAARALAGMGKVALAIDGPTSAAAEGLAFGAYAFDAHRSRAGKLPLGTVTVLHGVDADAKTMKAVLNRVSVLAEAVHTVRDLVNTPPGHLVPIVFADKAKELGEAAGLTVTVWDEKELHAGGFGGISGVGQGSVNPPRLVRLQYTPPKATKKVALVGKGLTFDSGGLSIKPGPSMETMKLDMAGAAAVLAATIAAAKLKVAVTVDAWLGIAENMPSGEAIRPGDVLTMLDGQTVEVLNTDAEGRLVLADVLVRAAQENPDLIVDVATLTGAQIVALGSRVSGVMGTDGARDRVHAAAVTAGELTWPMPLPVELREGLDSSVADLQNIAGPQGGMLTAGLFLKAFVPEGVEWAHVDIAGPSYNEKAPWGYTPKGGTGVIVRTFVALLEDVALNG